MEKNEIIKKYQTLLNSVPSMIFFIDGKRNIIEVNKKINEFGYEVEEIIGKNLSDLPLFPFKDEIEKAFDRKGEIFKVSLIRKDGEKRTGICIVSEIKEKEEYMVILHDITEEEILRLSLKEEDEILRNWYELFENAVSGIYIYDENLKFLYVNPSACKMLGYSKEEMIEKMRVLDIIYDEDIDKVKEIIRKRFSGELDIASFDVRLKDKFGKIKYCYATGKVGKIGDKKVIMGNILDITEKVEYEKKLREKHLLLEETLNGVIYSMSKIVEIRDPYTAGHQLRVSQLSEEIARELKYNEEQLREIIWASLLHDMGKITIPSEILVLPRKLTPIEFSIVKTHPVVAYNILKVIPNFEKLSKIVLQHHERLDGSGYPHGLKGDSILKEARILAVSDVVEAMLTNRPYRPALSLEETIDEIKRNKGIKYDGEVVDICIDLFKRKGFSFD